MTMPSDPTEDKVKLPKKVMVLGKVFTVKRLNIKDYGEMIGHEGLIKVKSGLSKDMAKSTLVHEIIHAALHTSGLSQVLEGLGDKEMDIEEAIVICLENALAKAVDLEKFSLDNNE